MATATFTTVVDRSVGDPITEAIWDDQLKDNLNQLAGAHRNQLVNGGMEVWQRGAGSFTTSVYTADRWSMTISNGTATVTQETSVVDTSSGSSLKIVTAGGIVTTTISQRLEHLTQLRGRTLAVSARVQQSVSSGVGLTINDASGASTSGASTTTGSFVTLTATRAVGASDAGPLSVTFTFGAAGTFYLDNVMLVIGPAPAPYMPLHPAEEMERCQRYYELHGGVNNAMGLNAYAAAGANYSAIIQFATAKYGVPTMTKNGTWGVVNSGQPATNAPTKDGYTLFATATALGTCSFGNNSTDDTIVAEVNP